MDWHTWMAFFAASWVIAISPGSGAVLSMSHGLSYGVRKTGATILGLELGLLFILIVAGAGVGSLLIASELAFTVVKVLGAAYLTFICLVPEYLVTALGIPFYLGGTSLLIVVNVTIDTVTQIQSHLLAHQYGDLIKKAKLKGRMR